LPYYCFPVSKTAVKCVKYKIVGCMHCIVAVRNSLLSRRAN
jgi:hypothetical protein